MPSYKISQTLNNKVSLGALEKQIAESMGLVAISSIDGDELDIEFKFNLTEDLEARVDTIVFQHDGEPLPYAARPVILEEAKNDEGVLKVSPFYMLIEDSWRRDGEGGLQLPVPGALNVYDKPVGDRIILLAGGEYSVMHAKVGDYIEFSIIDVDGILDMGELFEINKFIRREFVNPDRPFGDINPPSVSRVIPGLYMRSAYFAVPRTDEEDNPILFYKQIWYER